MATRVVVLFGAAALGLWSLLFLGVSGEVGAAERKMALCMHSNTSAAAGYRRSLEGWAKAGIKNVEMNALVIEDFLKTDTPDGARKVLSDNGLTMVHGAVAVDGLLEPDADHAKAIENLKRRLELFASFGPKKVYTTSAGTRKLASDEYKIVAENMRSVGDTAKAFNMLVSVEFVRASPFMSTLLTALK